MAGEAHSVKRHLDVGADSYDIQIRRFIPHYEDMIETGVELLAALAPADGHVLDLGGGTGALAAAVLDGLPGVRVTVLDVDREMLGEARLRLARHGERAASSTRCPLRTPSSPRWRCITSTTSPRRGRCTAQFTTRSRPEACCSTSTPP